jgi:esterase/lipase
LWQAGDSGWKEGAFLMEAVISAVIASGLSLVGVIITTISSNKRIEQQLMMAQAVTDTKIQNLTDEVKKHNTFADRITKLEVKVEALEKGGKP